MVPSDGNFPASIAKKGANGVVQGQTRQHARLLNLLGVKQLVVGVNKMDCDVAKYGKERFTEIKETMELMLKNVGWKNWIECDAIPILPLSGWCGDNLTKPSENMKWWEGVEIKIFKKQKVSKKIMAKKKYTTLKVHTLLDCLEKMVKKPAREDDKPTRMPVSGVYKIKGCGDVITGRIEQGVVKKEDRVIFLPTHTASKDCRGKVFSIEMHHRQVDEAHPGDNVGLNVKNLKKENMPRVGDIMVDEKEEYLRACASFTAKVSVLDHPGELKKGYTPIAFIRTGRAPVKIEEIVWKITPKTGADKIPNPPFVKANNMAEIKFVPQGPFVVDTFKSCEGLGRVAIMEGNSAVMLGTVEEVIFKDPNAK